MKTRNAMHHQLFAVLLIFAGILFTGSASAYQLKAMVVDTQGARLAGATVQFHAPETGIVVYGIQADANGYFEFADIAEGEYQIRVSTAGFPDQWTSPYGQTTLRQYRTNIGVAASPDTLPIVVNASPVDNIPNNTLTVTVRDSAGGIMPEVQGIYVTLMRKGDRWMLPGDYLESGSTLTFDSLQPAEYGIILRGNMIPEQFYHPDRNTEHASYFLPVAGGVSLTQNVNIYDPPAGTAVLNGYCRSETDGALAGITVSLCQPSDTFKVLYSVTTGTEGNFNFVNIRDMDYFMRLSGSGYPVQYYSRSRNATTLYPEEMLWPMHFAGTTFTVRLASDPVNNPASGNIRVNVWDSTLTAKAPGGNVYFVNTSSSLVYTPGYDTTMRQYLMENIPVGNYYLKLDIQGFPVQYFQPSNNTSAPSYNFTVSANSNLIYDVRMLGNPASSSANTGANAYVKGFVRDSAGTLGNAVVYVYSSSGIVIASGTTTNDGTFSTLSFMPQGIAIAIKHPSYPQQFWSPQGMSTQLTSAGMLNAVENDTIRIDAMLKRFFSDTVAQQQVRSITVKVTDASSNSLMKNVRVVLFDFDPGNFINIRHLQTPWTGFTDSTGKVVITNVPFGKYRCLAEAESLGYVAQFFPKSDLLTGAKQLVVDSTVTTMNLDFALRKGGILAGKVVTATGTLISDARIYINNVNQTRSLEGVSLAGGGWKISGIPAGTWNVWVNHDRYLAINDTVKRMYNVTEGSATTVKNFLMEEGGYVKGTFTSPQPINDTANTMSLYRGGDLVLFPKPAVSVNPGDLRWPAWTTGITFESTMSGSTSGIFRSSIAQSGSFELMFMPRPLQNYSTSAALPAIQPSWGYSFMQAVTIPKADTIRDITLALRKGFSIFGTLKTETGSIVTGNFLVDAFIKKDSVLYRVAHSVSYPNGRFELPGLIDNEAYYLQFWADGYQPQFYSDSGATAAPVQQYKLIASTYSPLTLTLSKNITGPNPGPNSSPIKLWVEGDSAGMPLVKWQLTSSALIDSFVLYRNDRSGKVELLKRLPFTGTGTQNAYRDNQTGITSREYVVVGKGPGNVLRSGSVWFDSRQTKTVAGPGIWLDVYNRRWGVQLEWGASLNVTFTTSDSVEVYRASGTDVPKLLYRRSCRNTMLEDYSWSRADSGKTFLYSVEIPRKGLKSPAVSFTLDAAFYSKQPKVLNVGPYERYQRISDAIAAASDFDQIQVRPGTYRENISLGGKNISINAAWDFGTPPVIDGGGATAITIPYCKTWSGYEYPRISGFAIKNSATGIASQSDVEVETCLFDNVTVAIAMVPDSTAMITQMSANPFRRNTIDARIKHCTAIAQKSGSLFATLTAVGKAEQAGYTGQYSGVEPFYISPAVSLASSMSIAQTCLAFYQSSGLQSSFPVTLQGNTGKVDVAHSNLWKTARTSRYSRCYLDTSVTMADPQFADSIWWFVTAASPLAGSSYESHIGYDVNSFSDNGGSGNASRPGVVKNITYTNVGLNALLITWTASPAAEKVNRYRIYRIPGKPELFYVNQLSEWDIKISEDSLFSIIDSFSTGNNAFLDTTIATGVPYLYVVVAVNDEGEESNVHFPSPPDISSYFVNKLPCPVTLAANKWHMIGIGGAASASFASETPHALYGWNDKNPSDKLYAQYYRTTNLQPADGYWCKFTKDTSLAVTSASLASLKNIEQTVAVTLNRGTTGWNLVSSPFPFAIKPSWMTSFDMWEWNADSVGYRKATVIKPCKAYWVYTAKDTTLGLWKKQTLAELLAKPLAKSKTSGIVWQLQLSLACGKSYDTDNFIGAVSDGSLVVTQKPPAPMNGARLYIVPTSKDGCGTIGSDEKLAALYKKASAQDDHFEWQFGIGARETEQVLAVGGMASLPSTLHAFWVDKNRIVNLRENGTVSFTASENDQHGIVVVTAHPELISIYNGTLNLRSPFPNPSRGIATIAYTIPYNWTKDGLIQADGMQSVRLSLFDLYGRQVVTMVNSKKTAGTYTLAWQGNNGSGNKVAPGVYLIKLSCGKMQKVARLFRVE